MAPGVSQSPDESAAIVLHMPERAELCSAGEAEAQPLAHASMLMLVLMHMLKLMHETLLGPKLGACLAAASAKEPVGAASVPAQPVRSAAAAAAAARGMLTAAVSRSPGAAVVGAAIAKDPDCSQHRSVNERSVRSILGSCRQGRRTAIGSPVVVVEPIKGCGQSWH